MTENSTLPFISIVIPALNEAEFIGICLNSINQITYPAELYEIIVADNGSVDNTQAIAQDRGAKVYDFPCVKIGELRNLGVKESQGQVIAFVDADCIVPKGWIFNALETLSDEATAVVGGNCPCREDANWIESAWALDKGDIFSDVEALATGSFIVKKEVFEEVGGFDETVVAGEDTEISQRIVKTGKKLKLNSKCNVIHLGYPRTIYSFVRRQVWQTSDYLRALKSGGDKTFILTVIFLLSFISIPLNMFYVSGFGAFLSALTLSIVPAIGMMFRIKQSVEKRTIKLFVSVFSIQTLYFIGRSIGLTISFYKETFGKLLPSNK